MQQSSGYPAQQQQQQDGLATRAALGRPAIQQTKFYKSGFFSSAAGRFERDLHKMEASGWKLQSYAFLGMNLWLQLTICVTYVQ